MKIVLLISLVVLFSLSVAGQDVDISRLYVESDQDTTYILDYAVTLIPTYKKVSLQTINCVVAELKKSGMFENINSRLVTDGEGKYHLILKPVYKSDPSHFVVTKISIEGFGNVDKKAFLEKLAEQKVKVGVSFTPYLYIRQTIVEKLNDFDAGEKKRLADTLWINAYLSSPSSVSLVISQGIPTCPAS